MSQYDVFLSHNSKSKPVVRDVKQRLATARLKVWYDEDELRPGIPWQELLEAGIKASKSVAVLVGPDGFGPWEDEEMQGALRLAVKDRRPVIPVLLPGCPEAPELPMFLGNRTWVDLRDGLTEQGFGKLLWGITGVRPDSGGSSDPEPPPIPRPKPRQTHEAAHFQAPVPAPAPATLMQLLPGVWMVQIQLPYSPGMMGQGQLEMYANGVFRGQMSGPLGMVGVEGQWQANAVTNVVSMQGMQSNGFQTMPYVVMVQVTFFDAQRIAGVTSAGEQVTLQRLR